MTALLCTLIVFASHVGGVMRNPEYLTIHYHSITAVFGSKSRCPVSQSQPQW